MSDPKRYDIQVCDEYATCQPMVQSPDGDYILVDDLVAELRGRIEVTNTLPGEQRGYRSLLRWLKVEES